VNISSTLLTLKKHNLFQSAYSFYHIKAVLERFFASNYPNFEEALKNSKIFIKQENKEMKIIIRSLNSSFCSWLMMEKSDILKQIKPTLLEKKINLVDIIVRKI
jgi:hypothetical protein